MKAYPFIYLLAAALLLPASAHAGGACNTKAQKRVVIGKRPTANTLYAHIQGVGMGSWISGFDKETFVYIGDVHTKSGKTYKIGHLKTIAGRECIAFQRLFIFDAKDNYLGQYAPVEVDAKKISIHGSTLVFPFNPKSGNKLDLSKGPPAKASLDGYDQDWSPAPALNPPPAPSTAPPPSP